MSQDSSNVHESTFWARQLTPYHWFVYTIACLAWFFDCLDQRLFSLARIPALADLMESGDVQAMGKNVTALFLIGWGVGGLVFGPLGDRFGRARMLTFTVLLYSLCTGLTFFSRTLLGFGIAFEIPVFVVLLNMAGILKGKALGAHRPWMIVGTFIFAAVMTPSGDPFTMTFMAVPMVVLFLISEVIARFNLRLASESEGRDLDPGTLLRGVRMLLSDPRSRALEHRVVGGSRKAPSWSSRATVSPWGRP